MQSFELKSWFRKPWVRAVIAVILAFVVGYIIRGPGDEKGLSDSYGDYRVSDLGRQAQEKWWTCSMHPQIHQPKPGKCPICGMDLVPVATEASAVDERQISFSENALKLMEIR